MLCTEARRYGLTICPELHIDTLTDNYESALRLLDEVGEENFRLYWQPNQFRDDGYNLNALKTLIPFVTNIHVFHWIGSNMYPLIDGEYIWKKYIEIISSDCNDHNLLLEFVCDGSTDQFRRDADTLKHWIGK